MRQRLLILLALILAPASVQAQAYYANVQLTIDNTSGGVSFTSTDILIGSGHPQVNTAFCVSNSTSGEFRYRVDGGAPTTTNGIPVPISGAFSILNTSALLNFKGIRTGGTSAVITCNFSDSLTPPTTLVGAGGGGSGGSVTQGTSPWIVAGGGTAGSPGTAVLTVQGISSGTAVTVAPSSGSFATDNTVDGNPIGTTGPLVLCNGNSAALTAVTAGRAQYIRCNLNGELYMAPAPGTLVSGAITSAMTGTTSTSLVSGTGSNYLYITSCVVSNASTTVSTDILLQDGSGGTTLAVLPAPAATVATTGGGGATHTFGTAPLKVPTSGNALYAANVTTGSSTKISCNGFRSTVSY